MNSARTTNIKPAQFKVEMGGTLIIWFIIFVLQADDCDHYAYIYTPLACPFAAQNWTKANDNSVAENQSEMVDKPASLRFCICQPK